MDEAFQEVTRIIKNPGEQPQIYIERKTMSVEELVKSRAEYDALIRGMKAGGVGLLNGLEKLFADLDPELKEAIDRARRVGRFH